MSDIGELQVTVRLPGSDKTFLLARVEFDRFVVGDPGGDEWDVHPADFLRGLDLLRDQLEGAILNAATDDEQSRLSGSDGLLAGLKAQRPPS